ncbi:MAG: hypothetical protein ABEJ61_07465 [Haloferacaceae archaeon]
MYSPSAAARETDDDHANAPSRVEHYGCALAGLGAVAAFLLAFTPLLFELTQQFAELSPTVIVFGLAALWVLVWLSLESLWEWRAGRLPP